MRQQKKNSGLVAQISKKLAAAAGKVNVEIPSPKAAEPGFSGPSVASLAAIAAGAALLSLGTHASANTTIIQDGFTLNTNPYGGTALASYGAAGQAPSGPGATNLPGGTYQPASSQASNFAGEYNGPQNTSGLPVASFRSDSGVASALTLGTYNTGTLQVSGSILYGNDGNTPQTPPPTGITGSSFTLLGFNSQTDSSGGEYDGVSPFRTFTGLEVTGNGSLQAYYEGAAVGSSIAFTGTYNPLAPTTLSYDINTLTGAISDVSFGASTSTYAFTTGTFASADTSYVEIGGYAPAGGDNGNAGEALFSSLNVSAVPVPEPASLGLLAIGSVGLLARRKRRSASESTPAL